MKPYYEHAGITIYHGDCREILPRLAIVDALILTDPPYGNGIRYESQSITTLDQFEADAAFLISLGHPLIFTCSVLNLWRIPKPSWVAVWEKPMVFGYRNTALLPHWEPIVFYGTPKSNDTQDIFRFNPEAPNGHPTPKPLNLYIALLRSQSWADLVVDPFMGSGTTLRAAKNLSRRAIGVEISETYCEIAAKRLNQEVFDFDRKA